jgi:hypothetical protein
VLCRVHFLWRLRHNTARPDILAANEPQPVDALLVGETEGFCGVVHVRLPWVESPIVIGPCAGRIPRPVMGTQFSADFREAISHAAELGMKTARQYHARRAGFTSPDTRRFPTSAPSAAKSIRSRDYPGSLIGAGRHPLAPRILIQLFRIAQMACRRRGKYSLQSDKAASEAAAGLCMFSGRTIRR